MISDPHARASSARHAIGRPIVVIVMGVSGSGKTTIGTLLAQGLEAEFLEGDDLHPRANVEKMHAGTPLTDADRLPWLQAIAAKIDAWRAQHQSGVVSCSALKKSYRDIIIGDRRDMCLVWLEGSYDLIRQRLAARHAHFMPVALLDSQFASLEGPGPDENPIIADVTPPPRDIAAAILPQLEKRFAQPELPGR